ncbi:hypothetical protein B7463_g8501, partial [Scytalidium lignicola]
MSDQLDHSQIERLKDYYMQWDEATLLQMYREFRQQNSSSGRMSKEIREKGMAYLAALAQKEEQRLQLEEQQRLQLEEQQRQQLGA